MKRGPKPRAVPPLTSESKKRISDNIPLIWWEVRRQHPRDEHEADEWFQEGALGVVRQIHLYEEDRGEFSEWIVRVVRYSVWKFRQAHGGVIVLPHTVRSEEDRNLAGRSRVIVSLEYERPGENREGADYPDYVCKHMEVYDPFYGGGSSMEAALEGLEVEDRRLIYMRYYKCLSLEEIAEVLEISGQWVSKKIKKALKRLSERYCELEDLNIKELPKGRVFRNEKCSGKQLLGCQG